MALERFILSPRFDFFKSYLNNGFLKYVFSFQTRFRRLHMFLSQNMYSYSCRRRVPLRNDLNLQEIFLTSFCDFCASSSEPLSSFYRVYHFLSKYWRHSYLILFTWNITIISFCFLTKVDWLLYNDGIRRRRILDFSMASLSSYEFRILIFNLFGQLIFLLCVQVYSLV